MIRNERQYRITKTQAANFERALANIIESEALQKSSLHPVLQKAQQDALRSQLEDLRGQLQEYDALQSGQNVFHVSGTFDALPSALIKARIAQGLSQKELALRMGLKEQQIQRYESTGYAAASFERLSMVIKALGVSVTEDVRFIS
ncbi:hypothetical protein CCAX7_21530 [Capsulimonas corticalis]|uniref:Uncharacterized protein n=1 Tax=Capsulimonas corticalis TaxID=2219043 RepID=A0A402D237_9BACT|nr:helix-turn-helix transcriptional regulator [Capsulimonas corticalis]BDI30102.1 hypothetical protein CCAX7_21530 [Capsulimonas corticalis]